MWTLSPPLSCMSLWLVCSCHITVGHILSLFYYFSVCNVCILLGIWSLESWSKSFVSRACGMWCSKYCALSRFYCLCIYIYSVSYTHVQNIYIYFKFFYIKFLSKHNSIVIRTKLEYVLYTCILFLAKWIGGYFVLLVIELVTDTSYDTLQSLSGQLTFIVFV